MKVVLAEYEQKMANYVGYLRRIASRGVCRNANGLEEDDEAKLLAMDVEGAGGEIAVAKATNRYWHGSVNAEKNLPDVGTNIQVRTTKHLNGSLIITKRDSDEQIFFLVTGSMPEYHVKGYIRGIDGKKEEFVRAVNGRPPAFFVPQSQLKKLKPL